MNEHQLQQKRKEANRRYYLKAMEQVRRDKIRDERAIQDAKREAKSWEYANKAWNQTKLNEYHKKIAEIMGISGSDESSDEE